MVRLWYVLLRYLCSLTINPWRLSISPKPHCKPTVVSCKAVCRLFRRFVRSDLQCIRWDQTVLPTMQRARRDQTGVPTVQRASRVSDGIDRNPDKAAKTDDANLLGDDPLC